MIGIDPLYFLDEMSQDEMNAIFKAKNETDKTAWEQTRTICFYSVASMNGTKQFKKPSDLFSFTWEKPKPKKTMTKEEILAKMNKNGR